MSVHEIVQIYKGAKDKNAQIEILADLNNCSKEDILLVLENEGVIPGVKAKKTTVRKTKMTRNDEAKDQVQKLLAEGLTVLDVSERMGLDYSQVRNAITRFKLGKGQSAKCKMQNEKKRTPQALVLEGEEEEQGSKNKFSEQENDTGGLCDDETPHQSAALTASPQGEARESAEDKIEPLGVVSLIRDYAKCITSLPSADIRNYEKIVRTFAESIMEGADCILREAKEYGA